MALTFGSVCSGIEAKACAICAVEKPLGAFHKQGARRHSYCADCYNARYRGAARKPLSSEARRAQNVKTRYGLTPADIDAMKAAQDGACAICRLPLARFHIDHNHASGRVRGLLCHPCNVALAHVENETFRTAALAYLEGHS
jgi:hypothetical protein